MNFDLLAGSPLFRGLDSPDIMKLISMVPYRIRKFSYGSLIAQSNETVNCLMIVLTGTVKGEMTDETGRVIKIEDIPAPGALAAAFIFGNRNRFPVNVVSVTGCEILCIDKSDFLKLLMTNDVVLVNFLNMISSRSQFLSEKIRFLSFRTIRGKLAQLILQSASPDKVEVVLSRTRNELAEFFGVARPSVSRAFGELEQQGYIQVSGKSIRILDRKGLSGLTSD
jgi:CRP/FNR family transcriptional regulator, dissimilatory nitrate respiration regulator